MPRLGFTNRKRRWKMERASVRKKRVPRARTNKYSGGDTNRRPKPHTAKQMWVGGYKRKTGKRVKGYYRSNSAYRGKKR